MNHRSNYIYIITLLFLFFVTPVAAQQKSGKSILRPLSILKKEKKSKKNEMIDLGPAEPDRMPSRTRPDHFLKPIRKPHIFFIPTTHELHGYDMSHYQGNVEWDIIGKDPLAGFIYLKATEGVALVDNKYEYNLNECHRVGLKVGSYHFFRAQLNPEEQFDNFMSVVDIKKQNLIPLVDVEVLPRNVPHYIFIQRLQTFCDLVEKAFGTKPMIYTGRNFYDKHLARTNICAANYKFMIAAYIVDEPVLTNDDDYLIWQFTGTGKANGIRGKVDISRFRGNHHLNEIMY